MNRRLMWIVGVLVVVGGLVVFGVYRYVQPPEESPALTAKEIDDHYRRQGKTPPPRAPIVLAPAKPIDATKPVRLATGWLGLPDDAQNQQAADLVLARLSPVRNLQMVERQSLDKVLRESEMGLSGLVRAGSAVRVGKLVRADWFLLGTAATVNGSNYVVVRLVDARSGVMRDAGVFSREGGVGKLAEELAGFVKQSREAASKAGKPRTYLSLGGFQDLSINNRQAEFPAKLRGYLTAAFQGNTNFTLLEREFADTLLQEVRLDLAGLTEEGGTNAPQPMQAAFWLVDGYYQSYETAGYEVELALRVNRMFGRSGIQTLQGPPGDKFYEQIRVSIESNIVNADPVLLSPTRRSEIWAQLEMAQGLYRAAVLPAFPTIGTPWLSERERIQAKRKLEEAIRAYQVVLILEPENHEAKMGLATCFQVELIGKSAEARELFREVAESPQEDKWTGQAMASLAQFYRYEDARQAAELFQRASEVMKRYPSAQRLTFSTPDIAEVYRREADQIAKELEAQTNAITGGNSEPESRLIAIAQEMQADFRAKKVYSYTGSDRAIELFVRSYGTNRAEAVNAMNEALPVLVAKFPDLEPELVAIVLSYQTDTNSPIFAQFVKSFESCAANPDKVFVKHVYFWRLARKTYGWLLEKKACALAIEIIEAKKKVQMKDGFIDNEFMKELRTYADASVKFPYPGSKMALEDDVRLVYAYMGLGRWQEVLDILNRLPDRPFYVEGNGPWGALVITTDLIADCRRELGLPAQEDPRSFKLPEPWLTFQDPTVFATEDDTVWVAICCRLWKHDMKSGGKIEIPLPKRQVSRITVLCCSPSSVWVGTAGDGVIEYDKKSGKCRKYSEQDGLMANDISALCVQGDTLWVGFGPPYPLMGLGGIGKLDLRTGKAIAFTPHLAVGQAPANAAGPPRNGVFGIVPGRPDELFVSTSIPTPGMGLCRYQMRSDAWEAVPWTPACLTADANRLILGLNESDIKGSSKDFKVVATRQFSNGQWERFGTTAELLTDRVTAIGLERNDLWLGGYGLLGVLDLETKAMRKYCFIKVHTVDHIEVAGGYAWAQFDNHIYRIPVSITK